MNSTAKAADKFELASNFCVGDYKRLRREKDRGGIAKFIYKRFSERYLAPLFSIPSEKKNGFCMMAIACLMIEALASFRKGWKDTSRKGRGKSAFQSFLIITKRLRNFVNTARNFTGMSDAASYTKLKLREAGESAEKVRYLMNLL